MIAPQRLLRLPSVICEACSQLGRSFRATERWKFCAFVDVHDRSSVGAAFVQRGSSVRRVVGLRRRRRIWSLRSVQEPVD